jgi:hypothetical protein
LRKLFELSEDVERRLEQRRVLRLRHVRHAARQVQAHPVVGGLQGQMLRFFKYFRQKNWRKNLCFLLKTKQNCAKITLVSEKNTKFVVVVRNNKNNPSTYKNCTIIFVQSGKIYYMYDTCTYVYIHKATDSKIF